MPPSAPAPVMETPKPGEVTPPPAAPIKEPAAPQSKKAEATPPTTPPETPPAKVVPEKYDLKLPEGAHLDAAHVERIAAYSKAQGLTNEEAQAIVERDNANLASYVEGQTKQLETAKKEWFEAVKADKEIGGEAFNTNVELAKRVIDKYGSDNLKSALNDTGLGNHPELVRLLARIGKAMTEDNLVLPGPQSGGKKTLEETFYGNSTKEN